MVDLIPPPESVMDILTRTEAYRKGHFIYPNGKHASHYFQMPLAFRYYDNARILSVGLSRMFRRRKLGEGHIEWALTLILHSLWRVVTPTTLAAYRPGWTS